MTDQEWEEWRASLKAESDALDAFERQRTIEYEILEADE